MRIRTIKPVVCTSRSVARLSSDSVRLYWERLWMYADDEGRGIEEPRLIKAALFPLDDNKTPDIIAGYQAELEAEGMIVRYWWKGERVFAIPEWGEHQKIDRPKDSEIPPPDQGDPEPPPCEESSKPRRSDIEPSSLEVEVEVEVEGKQETTLVDTPKPSTALVLLPDHVPQAAPRPDPSTRVFLAWCESTGRDPARTKLDPKRHKAIRDALKNYPCGDVIDAVRGWKHSSHHRGENERGTTYNELTLLLRDAAQIEKFRDLQRRHGDTPHRRLPARMAGIATLMGGASA